METSAVLPEDQIDAQAQRFFDAFCAGDWPVVETCLSDDFTAWHNTDNAVQTRAEHIATLVWLKKNISGMRYEQVSRQPLPDGFIQQHVLAGTVGDVAFELIACVIGRFAKDGRLLETREYLDSRQLRSLYQK